MSRIFRGRYRIPNELQASRLTSRDGAAREVSAHAILSLPDVLFRRGPRIAGAGSATSEPTIQP
jgi:hypothetical protein